MVLLEWLRRSQAAVALGVFAAASLFAQPMLPLSIEGHHEQCEAFASPPGCSITYSLRSNHDGLVKVAVANLTDGVVAASHDYLARAEGGSDVIQVESAISPVLVVTDKASGIELLRQAVSCSLKKSPAKLSRFKILQWAGAGIGAASLILLACLLLSMRSRMQALNASVGSLSSEIRHLPKSMASEVPAQKTGENDLQIQKLLVHITNLERSFLAIRGELGRVASAAQSSPAPAEKTADGESEHGRQKGNTSVETILEQMDALKTALPALVRQAVRSESSQTPVIGRKSAALIAAELRKTRSDRSQPTSGTVSAPQPVVTAASQELSASPPPSQPPEMKPELPSSVQEAIARVYGDAPAPSSAYGGRIETLLKRLAAVLPGNAFRVLHLTRVKDGFECHPADLVGDETGLIPVCRKCGRAGEYQFFVVGDSVGDGKLWALLPAGPYAKYHYPRGFDLLVDAAPQGTFDIAEVTVPAVLSQSAAGEGSYTVEFRMRWRS